MAVSLYGMLLQAGRYTASPVTQVVYMTLPSRQMANSYCPVAWIKWYVYGMCKPGRRSADLQATLILYAM